MNAVTLLADNGELFAAAMLCATAVDALADAYVTHGYVDREEYISALKRFFPQTYGATDDYGYFAVEDRMHIHDFHATVLALLGLQHDKLTYRYSGRDFRLTDVAGVVANKIMV